MQCIAGLRAWLKAKLATLAVPALRQATFKWQRALQGYAEVVRVSFDESIISPETVLDIYFVMHDPTTLNRQGADIGSQYRSIMLYQNDAQKQLFETAKAKARETWSDPIVTEIKPLETFYLAEEQHQNYFAKNPNAGYCQVVIAPKISKARQHYKPWFKEDL